MKLQGKVWRFGDNVNTDLIYPNRYFKTCYLPGEMGTHLMSGIDPDFPSKIRRGDMIIGGRNFGCGSSREEAAGAMKEVGVAAVLAPSFGRIFMRNCMNLGVPVLPVPGIDERVAEGDEVEIDLSSAWVRNLTSGYETTITRIAPGLIELLESGGLIEYTRSQLAARRAKAY